MELNSSASTDPTPPVRFSFEFKGSGAEYFRIWIVNLALTLVTAGFYSAWAKVRTRRYFDNHTFLDGSNFDYHGDPIKILKGRLIMGALLLTYSLGGKISPKIGVSAGLIFFAIFPWVLVKSMAFNLGNTSYRGLRLGFQGQTKTYYGIYFKSILVWALTLGLAYPFAVKWTKAFQIENTRYGSEYFRFKLESVKAFYVLYLQAGLFMLALFGVSTAMVVFNKQAVVDSKKLVIGLILFSSYMGLIAAGTYIAVGTFKILADAVEIKGLKSRFTGSVSELTWVYFSSILACIISFGLALPWARVRMLRAKLQSFQFEGEADALQAFSAGQAGAASASADAMGDFLNLDLDLGF